jgi:hypothetical protein
MNPPLISDSAMQPHVSSLNCSDFGDEPIRQIGRMYKYPWIIGAPSDE